MPGFEVNVMAECGLFVLSAKNCVHQRNLFVPKPPRVRHDNLVSSKLMRVEFLPLNLKDNKVDVH